MELNDIIKSLDNLIVQNKKDKALDIINKAIDSGEIFEDILMKAKYISRKKVGGKWVYDYGKKDSGKGGKKQENIGDFNIAIHKNLEKIVQHAGISVKEFNYLNSETQIKLFKQYKNDYKEKGGIPRVGLVVKIQGEGKMKIKAVHHNRITLAAKGDKKPFLYLSPKKYKELLYLK